LFVCFGAKIIEDFIWTTKSADIFLMGVKNNSGRGVAGVSTRTRRCGSCYPLETRAGSEKYFVYSSFVRTFVSSYPPLLEKIKVSPSIAEGLFNDNRMNKQRVIVYVDGFNFYFGLRSKKWKKYYWLDMVKFAEGLLRPHQELIEVNYFSAKHTNLEKSYRQNAFFQANKLNPKFTLHLGKYLTKNIECHFCKNIIHSYEEKETDVRIATTMLADMYGNRCDVSLLISADSDLVPPIERIKELNPAHKIIICFPPNRTSCNLKKWSNGTKELTNRSLYESSMLPEKVILPDGYELHRPEKWQ
jgi:uncharacterized LabA/DUF88 family protein